MTNVTLSMEESVYKGMKKHPDIKWSEFIRKKIKDSKINAVVIDIKDYSGYILYDTQIPAIKNIDGANIQMPDVHRQKILRQNNLWILKADPF